ncbi:MAG TPA: divalent-cation tolerance protein CutA [Acidimicrobiales bacterium]|nr:divalent-cation tolerance protein CutA [Acidimicrobiales bacterium]
MTRGAGDNGCDCYQVSVTAPSVEEAQSLGRMVVDGRLAACAQVSGPVTSTYRWECDVTSATEWLCTMKTTSYRLEALMAAVRDAHSYAVPEIIAIPVSAGDPDYLTWIDRETRA